MVFGGIQDIGMQSGMLTTRNGVTLPGSASTFVVSLVRHTSISFVSGQCDYRMDSEPPGD